MPDLPKTMQDQEGSRSSSEMDGKRNSLIDELSDLFNIVKKRFNISNIQSLSQKLEENIDSISDIASICFDRGVPAPCPARSSILIRILFSQP